MAFFERLARSVLHIVQQSPIGRLLCWKRRMDEAYQPADPGEDLAPVCFASSPVELIPDPIALQQKYLDSLVQVVPELPPCRGIPHTMENGRPVIWLLHLFSGRRRSGDCHSWVTRLGGALWPGVDIYLLSFDTALHATVGNLLRGDHPSAPSSIGEEGSIRRLSHRPSM